MTEVVRITEEQWHDALIASEPFHQWGSAFLVEEGGHVVAWVRDVTGEGRHARLTLDEQASRRAREGVEEIEAASRRAADLVTAIRDNKGGSLDELRAQEEASAAFVALAEKVYRELLTL